MVDCLNMAVAPFRNCLRRDCLPLPVAMVCWSLVGLMVLVAFVSLCALPPGSLPGDWCCRVHPLGLFPRSASPSFPRPHSIFVSQWLVGLACLVLICLLRISLVRAGVRCPGAHEFDSPELGAGMFGWMVVARALGKHGRHM